MTITQLRKIFPKRNLGNGERIILNDKTARVTKARSFGGCYKK
jgi:hypothetical protein